MAEFASIPFWEQTGIADQQELKSSVFDVAAYGQVITALKVSAMAGTTKAMDVTIQHSMDMDQWATLTSFTAVSATTHEIVNSTKFARYIRAVVDTTAASENQTVTFSLLGIARDIG